MGSPPCQAKLTVGPGCAAYATEHRSGRTSFAGMAADPLATAVAHNPLLTQLARAIAVQQAVHPQPARHS